MNITYIIGFLGAIAVMIVGMMFEGSAINPVQVTRFFDPASIFITIGCTVFTIIASFPAGTLKHIPKHFKVLMNTKKYNPMSYIDQLVELAQVARKDGLLALEEYGNKQEDPFFKQCIMLVVDNNDPDKVREIMTNEIEQTSARHEAVAAMYDRGSSVSPAFGMVGTLVGLINMLKNMNLEDGSGNLGNDMGVALITTLYGCILAHVVFSPIANNLRTRDEEEVICKQIIVEGIMSIQAGANPKFIKEKLLTFMAEKQRLQDNGEGKAKKSKKKD